MRRDPSDDVPPPGDGINGDASTGDPPLDVASGGDTARVAYRGAAADWTDGPMLAYGPLADHLVASCPVPLAGARVLDAGAGTGAAGSALRRRGAIVFSADIQRDMFRCGSATMPIEADVCSLPLRDGAVDVAIAAFVVNHLDRPHAGLAELARVCRRGGAVLASTFPARRAASKDVIDAVARRHGWRPPEWYSAMQRCARGVDTPDRLAAAARGARFASFEIVEAEVDLGWHDPASICRYRLGMPQLAPFVRSLDPAQRTDLLEEAIAVVSAGSAAGEPFRLSALELVARVS